MKNIKLVFALSLLLACSSVYCQSIQIGPTVQRITFEWPLKYVNNVDDYGKKDLLLGKFDNFAIQQFQSNLCADQQVCTRQNFNPLLIKLADYKYLSSYYGFKKYNDENNTFENLKFFFEVYTCCMSQKQLFSFLIGAHKKFSIVKTLESKGIVPSKTKFYTIEQFHNALKDLFGGVKPQLFCGYSLNSSSYFNYLTHIELTLDSNLNVTGDCADRGQLYGSCNLGQNFLYLPL